MANYIGDKSKYLSFADDKVIYNISDTYKDAMFESELSINKFNNWLLTRGLSLSKSKTKSMIFAHKEITREEITLRINLSGTEIEQVENMRFLGVIINNKLEWEKHIDYTVKKAKSYITILRAISSLNVGAHPKTLLTIYKGLVRATADWGSMYYHDGREIDLIRVDRIQYAALTSCLGCIKTTPINVLLHLASEPSLKCRQFLTKKYIARTIVNSKNLLIPKLKLMKETYDKRPLRGITYLHNLFRIWNTFEDDWDGIETTTIPCCFLFSYNIDFTKVESNLLDGYEIKNVVVIYC